MTTDKSDAASDAGLWLALGGILLAVVLPLHGPTQADLSVQMQDIADGHGRWAVVHWLAAISLILLAGAGFLFFVELQIRRRAGTPAGAWLLFAIGSLVTIGTAVSEATAISSAAGSDDFESFVMWWRFASGLGNGFMIVALATAAIAWAAGSAKKPLIPPWACRVASIIALLSAIGWSLAQHFRLELGGPIWFVSTLLTSLWLAWYGFRSRGIAGSTKTTS
ncbi:MAG: hypothetical protein JSV66_01040 [Trueperaceae bacterium]|nr:MAG: hypothetical protein JSV66_01040 [Trueperaceae bacterium]